MAEKAEKDAFLLTKLRKAFDDICEGFSVGRIKDTNFYVKHLGHKEYVNFELIQQEYESKIKKEGLPTNADRLEFLKKNNLWNEKKDFDIEKQKSTIIRFQDGKKKVHLPSMLQQYDKEIETQTFTLNRMIKEKNDLIGLTVEKHAEKLVNDYFILKNLYKDQQLTIPFFSESEFDDLNDDEVSDIISLYNDVMEPCSDKNLKRISVQDFFQKYYFVSGDDLGAFFGKPIIKLTYSQITLGNYAKYFKNIFENHDLSKMPTDSKNDPDEIENFISVHRNAKDVMSQQKGGSVGLVGATKEDLKALGLDKNIGKLPQKELSQQQLAEFLEKR